MTDTYDPTRTAILLVDPYNDFLSEGGKVWPALEPVATEVGLLDNLRAVVGAGRAAGQKVFFVPHRRWQEGDYEDWEHPNPTHRIIQEHWSQSGFANTDLDFRLKQQGITHVIVIGLLANTCIESTGRYAMELGYHVTLVRDATAAYRPEMMHAAHELNGPTYAHSITTTADLVKTLENGDH